MLIHLDAWAELVGVSRARAHQWHRSGRIPTVWVKLHEPKRKRMVFIEDGVERPEPAEPWGLLHPRNQAVQGP